MLDGINSCLLPNRSWTSAVPIVNRQYTILCVMRLCDGADLEVGLSTRTVSDMQISVRHHD